MTYRYDCTGEVLHVFVWNDTWHNTVRINNEEDAAICSDMHGNFFEYNGSKIYLADFSVFTPAELSLKIKDLNSSVTCEDLLQTLIKYGTRSIKFFMCMQKLYMENRHIKYGLSHWNPRTLEEITECHVDPNSYSLKDNYRITLVPDDPSFMLKNIYAEDFFAMLRRGECTIKTSDTQHAEKVQLEEYSGGFTIKTDTTVVSEGTSEFVSRQG